MLSSPAAPIEGEDAAWPGDARLRESALLAAPATPPSGIPKARILLDRLPLSLAPPLRCPLRQVFGSSASPCPVEFFSLGQGREARGPEDARRRRASSRLASSKVSGKPPPLACGP